MKPYNYFLYTVGAIASTSLIAHGVTAADATDYAPSSTAIGKTGLPTTSAIDLALNIGRAFLAILGIIALVLIIYGGFMMLISQGEEDRIKKGRDTIFWAFIGLVIILSSLGIVEYIDSILF